MCKGKEAVSSQELFPLCSVIETQWTKRPERELPPFPAASVLFQLTQLQSLPVVLVGIPRESQGVE